MNPKNIKEFQDLIKRYESVTLEEINAKSFSRGHYVAQSITGFGGRDSCSLCRSAKTHQYEWPDSFCANCVYYDKQTNPSYYHCNSDGNAESYDAIDDAKSPEELLAAFRLRAKHLRETYPQYL